MLTIRGTGEVGIEVVFVPARLLVVAAKNIRREGVHGGDCERASGDSGVEAKRSASDSEWSSIKPL